ncbi:MAG: hypothetical protein IKR59_08845 [Lachnospiraceae bacterium]|nr:hypothetical protein [Lachnospiraceae bacterium]
MGLFRKRRDEETDNLIASVQMNMANNYKDAAQADFRKLKEIYEKKTEAGAYTPKLQAKYDSIMADFAAKLQFYTHGDQKPYWTKE